MNTRRFAIPALLLIVCLTIVAPASGDDYVEYRSGSSRQLLFQLFFEDDYFGYRVLSEDQTTHFKFDRDMIRVSGSTVEIKNDLLIDAFSFRLGNDQFSYDDITGLEVGREGSEVTIAFFTRSPDDRLYGRKRRGNRIAPFENTTISAEDFVRGSVFSVAGNIEVLGEVNGSVVSLFGDIDVGPNAVVRGNVASVSGSISLDETALVYGSVHSGVDSRIGRRHKFSRFRSRYSERFNLGADQKFTYYNRVDGLALGGSAEYHDPDSLLPRAWIGGGYAFESERWRYELGLEQIVLRHPAIALGGRMFRRLLSDDNRLISVPENTAFALLFRKDYLDYYEAEGAELYLKAKPVEHLTVRAGYRYEDNKWLVAERDLWSLFGGSKFSHNFGGVPEPLRVVGADEIDTSTDARLYARIDWTSRDRDEPFRHSAWKAAGDLEYSSPDLESSFDYTRYRVEVTRFQPIHYRQMILVRGRYGGSDGYLPMHRRFYLGGLGTIHGYDHKEYAGVFYWNINSEYRLAFPPGGLAASLLWDIGQTGASSSFGDTEVKHSLGILLYVGESFQLGVAKRLDRSYDDNPQVFARFSATI